MALKEDYKDAVFAGLRKYKMLDNGDGTVSPVDMTEYETAGDKFGAKDVNAITKTVFPYTTLFRSNYRIIFLLKRKQQPVKSRSCRNMRSEES